MSGFRQKLHLHRHTVLALAASAGCLVLLFLIWLAAVRPNLGKGLSTTLCDDYTVSSEPLEDGQTVTQSFSLDSDLLAMALVFSIPGEQPTGSLELTLADAETGQVLATSTGEMGNILPGQYTGLGLDPPVEGVEGRRYLLSLTPHYTGEGRLSVCYSNGAVLWDDTLTVAGQTVDGTLAMIVTYRRIGGFLTRFFLLVGLAACVVVFFGMRAALSRKVALHRLVFGLVLCFGLLYSVVLPPYAAPDEQYHINQSFTLACRWANFFSSEDWKMGNVPLTTSYRREHDTDPLLQEERTTVFTWQEVTDQLLTRSPDAFDSHLARDEQQTDRNPLLYLPSAAVVFLCFLLRLGFVPTLMLGRLANLLCFAALAALAVRRAPFGKRIFAAAALLPMTLHLAASFSRDALLLGLCFAFTALCAQAIYGQSEARLSWRLWLTMALCGLLLAPAKVVYLPLAALVLLIPAARLGRRAGLKKAGYLAACVLLALALNGTMLSDAITTAPETEVTETAEPVVQADTTSAVLKGKPSPETAETSAFSAVPEELLENTPEAFVRLLYYCTEETTDLPQKEVDFWVQALTEGDTTAALLAQSFFFSPEAVENPTLTGDAFISAASYVFLGRDVMQDDPDQFRTMQQTDGNVTVFKALYASEEAANRFAACGITVGEFDPDRYPLDRSDLQQEAEQARTVRENQSYTAEEDRITYTPGYILRHPAQTVMMLVRTLLQNTDHYLCTLVGGSLSYYSLDLAWGWVILLYLLLAYAALPTAEGLAQLPQGRYRVWGAVAALVCCALAVASCLLWTPVHNETLYGLQGRYFLPVLPLLLLTCIPRRATVRDGHVAASGLLSVFCLVHAGVLVNAMLVIVAR